MVNWNGKLVLLRDQPDLTIDSDGSNLDWGAFCQQVSTGVHQLPGIDHNPTGLKDIPDKQDGLVGVVENRQQNSGCVHKQPRGYCV